MQRWSALQKSGAGMVVSVVLGAVAAVVAVGKALGIWSVAGWVPMAFAVAGVLGMIVLIWFVAVLVKRFRSDA